MTPLTAHKIVVSAQVCNYYVCFFSDYKHVWISLSDVVDEDQYVYSSSVFNLGQKGTKRQYD